MRLPTKQEQQEIRDNNRRIAEGLAKAALTVAEMKPAFDAFASAMGRIRLDQLFQPARLKQ